MGVAERRRRDRTERGRRITAAARRIAAEEGWGAMTIRRLAEAIEYSQPVLYSHFRSREAIVAAVAVEGFDDLSAALKRAAKQGGRDRETMTAVAMAYLGFADEQPALYYAMFTMNTSMHFALPDTAPELRAAFAALAAVVPGQNIDTATETFWATLHGLAELERSGRIRRSARAERVAVAVDGLIYLGADPTL